jgi:flagellar basal body rod protein FlgG
MTDIFQIARIGLFDGDQRLQAISQNAANASLPGYRSRVVSGRAFDALLNSAGTDTPGEIESAGSLSPGVNLQRGGLLATGRALDVAIDADNAYFGLTDGTQTWLTRAGGFHIDANGTLLGERGLRVVGAGGDIRLPTGDVTVEADGRITFQGTTVATLQLLKPNDPTALQAATGSLLLAPSGTEVAVGVRLRGGALEASNTDSAHEMINLMAVARQFEAMSHLAQGYDEVVGRAIEKLGEV